MSHTMTIEPLHDVEYPESDGEPMAETDVHRDEMLALIDALKWRFRKEPDVYVAGNNFVYYEEGTPKAVFSPDVYVVRGVPKGQRRTFKLWQERHAPCFVMELSSRKTWLEDIGNKKALCQHLGIAEYFLYDPEGDVVKPPLQGFRLEAGRYEPIAPDTDGHLASAALGIIFRLDEALRLHARDASTGELLLPREDDLVDCMYRLNVKLFRSPLYRAVTLIASPASFLRGLELGWKLFRRGQHIALTTMSPTALRIRVTWPPLVTPMLIARCFATGFRAAAEATGTVTGLKADLAEFERTTAAYDISWR